MAIAYSLFTPQDGDEPNPDLTLRCIDLFNEHCLPDFPHLDHERLAIMHSRSSMLPALACAIIAAALPYSKPKPPSTPRCVSEAQETMLTKAKSLLRKECEAPLFQELEALLLVCHLDIRARRKQDSLFFTRRAMRLAERLRLLNVEPWSLRSANAKWRLLRGRVERLRVEYEEELRLDTENALAIRGFGELEGQARSWPHNNTLKKSAVCLPFKESVQQSVLLVMPQRAQTPLQGGGGVVLSGPHGLRPTATMRVAN